MLLRSRGSYLFFFVFVFPPKSFSVQNGLREFDITAPEGGATKDTNDACFGKTADVLHLTILVTIDVYNRCKT